MMLGRATIRSRLTAVEAELEPAPGSLSFDPEWHEFLVAMGEEGRHAFRALLKHRIERETMTEAEFAACPLGQAIQLARSYREAGLVEPAAFARASIETRIRCGLPEW
jgi:hypothetical protein